LWQEQAPATTDDTGFASSVKFRLTSRWPSVCFFQITEDQLGFTPDMKKIFIPSMLIAFAMICSCQKQDSAAETQLAQRKAELDARQNASDEREKELALRETVLNERGRPLAPKEKAIANARTIPDAAQLKAERDMLIQQPRPPEVQGLDPAQAKADPAQARAETERRLQQLGPDVKMLIPSRVQAKTGERNKRMQELLGQRHRKVEELQRSRMSAGVAPPAAEATLPPTLPPSLAVSPAAEATLPPSLAASPAAEATSPSPSPTPQ
jgi:hypothetical protein